MTAPRNNPLMNPEEKLPTRIYLRVSTKPQTKRHSYAFQFEDCEMRIQDYPGCQFDGVKYVDADSGANVNRKAYQQCISDAKRGLFKVLCVWNVDRLSRDSFDGHSFLKELIDDVGIKLISATENIDTDTASGRKQLREAFNNAEFERDRFLEKIRPGMERGAVKGIWQGARYMRYGYEHDKSVEGGRWKEKLNEVDVLKRIGELRAKGMSVYTIALALADAGIRNRSKRYFTTRLIQTIVTCSFYADGIYEWDGFRSAKPVTQPLWSKELWEKIQKVNQDRKREPKGISPGRVNSPYVLQGILKCIYCGSNMVGSMCRVNGKRADKVRNYICGKHLQQTRKACPGQRLKTDVCHNLAFEMMLKIASNPQLIEATKMQLKVVLERENPHLTKRVNELREMLQGLKREEDKCLKAYYADAISEEQLKAENKRIHKERHLATQELERADAKLLGANELGGKLEGIFDLFRNFESLWANMTHIQQRVTYRGMFNFLKIYGVKYSRCFSIDTFSLKEPFNSWYNSIFWNGFTLPDEHASETVTGNNNKDLCRKSTFAHLAAR